MGSASKTSLYISGLEWAYFRNASINSGAHIIIQRHTPIHRESHIVRADTPIPWVKSRITCTDSFAVVRHVSHPSAKHPDDKTKPQPLIITLLESRCSTSVVACAFSTSKKASGGVIFKATQPLYSYILIMSPLTKRMHKKKSAGRGYRHFSFKAFSELPCMTKSFFPFIQSRPTENLPVSELVVRFSTV